MTHLRQRLTYANVASTLALFLALGGGAYAATTIPGRDGVIHACYKQASGGTRIVAAGKKCRKGERAVRWNQQGPRGLAGAAGTPGANGASGPQGPAGPTASSFLSSNFIATGGLGTSLQSLGDLTTTDANTTSGGTITTTYPSRLLHASIYMFKPTFDAAQAAAIYCQAELSENGGAFARIGAGVQSSFPTMPTAPTPLPAYNDIGLAASKDVAAGTHNVRVTCQRILTTDFTGTVSARTLDLTAVAVGR